MKSLFIALRRLSGVVFILIVTFSAQAQYSLLKLADQQFDAFNFVKAIEIYKEAYAKQSSLHAMERIAESYYNIRNYREAEGWYQKAAQADRAKSEHVFRYAEVLQNNSKFREAKAQYARYAQMDTDFSEEKLKQVIASCDSAMTWMEQPLKHVELANEHVLNSAESDFGASQGPLGLNFVSDRFAGAKGSETIYGWTGNSFLSLYVVENGDPKKISVPGMEDNHIGPPTFSPDGQEMIFSLTRSPGPAEKRKAKKQMTVNIEIFTAKVGDPDWISNAIPFRYNNIVEWSVGDPFLSNSGDTLYFSSDMPGGFGGTDLYYVTRSYDNTWGEAVNLGPEINTPGDERFPAQDGNGVFYFSSNGHVGMGGLDIYKFENKKVVNLMYPVNSPRDDFSIRFVDGMIGYLSSNRQGGAGADDIYRFNLDKKIQISLEGGVFNAKTRLPISGAPLSLVSEGDVENSVAIRADKEGKFRFNLNEDSKYTLSAEQVGFKEQVSLTFNTFNIDSSVIIRKDIFLQPVEVKEVVVLRNIYFDYDNSDIRPDAALELDNVLSFLKSAPTAKIELSAHTDSRGSADYNLKLSQRRADSAVDYLASHGIARERLIAKGYGFTRMVNDCGKGSKCTEEEHAKNRRVEFIVLEQ